MQKSFPNSISPKADAASKDQSNFTRFKLECQAFIELLRSPRDLDSAFMYASQTLGSSDYSGPRFRSHLANVIALLAYPDIYSSKIGAYLMDQARREDLAREVNSWILVGLGCPGTTALERISRQLCVVQDSLAANAATTAKGGEGKKERNTVPGKPPIASAPFSFAEFVNEEI